jgi:cyclophilin family peptidyl-prolyl cis-trans isomerase
VALGGLVGILSLSGCGGGDGEAKAPTASIDGSGGAATSSSTAEGDAAKPTGPQRDPDHPVVEVTTSLGSFQLTLDAQKAPLTVDNFLAYVQEGHYDGTIFDQVYQGQGCIGGLYTPEMKAKKTRIPIRNEADNGLTNRRGTIAMVRAMDAIDSATSHFFINVADNPNLDHRDRTPEGFGYCVFGKVTQGMDVVEKISQVPVHDSGEFQSLPTETVMIESMRRVR